jgi:hypothetical protein
VVPVPELCPYCHNNEFQTVAWIDKIGKNFYLVTTQFCTYCGKTIGAERREVTPDEIQALSSR